MKILSYLNVSNISNLEADSGYIFQKLLLRSIIKIRPDIKIYFICPNNTPHVDDKITLLPIEDNYFNKYSVRFNFPWNKFMEKASILKDIDFAIINQPELALNFRALFSVIGNDKIKIASYFHYIPIEKFPSKGEINYAKSMNHGSAASAIFSRQLEAISAADYCVTCSKFAIKFIKSNAALINKSIKKQILNKIKNIPPPISISEVDGQKTKKLFNIKTLMYNHRLYAHYGTKLLFEWLSELFLKRQDFEVLVTDPTSNRNFERNNLDKSVNYLKNWLANFPFVRIKNIKNHNDYYKTLWKCYAGLAPLKPFALWSMSVVDFLACGKPVFAPNYACFPEMLNNNRSLIFKNKKDFFKKVNCLLDDENKYKKISEDCKKMAEKFTDEKVAKQFIDLF